MRLRQWFPTISGQVPSATRKHTTSRGDRLWAAGSALFARPSLLSGRSVMNGKPHSPSSPIPIKTRRPSARSDGATGIASAESGPPPPPGPPERFPPPGQAPVPNLRESGACLAIPPALQATPCDQPRTRLAFAGHLARARAPSAATAAAGARRTRPHPPPRHKGTQPTMRRDPGPDSDTEPLLGTTADRDFDRPAVTEVTY